MNKKIIIIVGALVGVLGAGAGVYFLKPELLGQEKGDKPNQAEKVKAHEPEVGADLEVFVVNLAGGGQVRYLRTSLSLGVKDEHDKEKVKEFSGPIRHAIIMYLTERKPEELNDPEGKNKIRIQLREQINQTIGHKLVANVYFREFLIQ